MHTKFERLLSKSLTTLEVMSYYLVVHTGPEVYLSLTRCAVSHKQHDLSVQANGAVRVKEEGGGGGGDFCLLVGCLTSQQQASVSQERICSDNCTCCHTEIEVADPTFYLTQSQYTDTGPTSPSADPITPGAWQGSHWSANFEVTGMTRPRKNPGASGIRTRNLPLSRRTP